MFDLDSELLRPSFGTRDWTRREQSGNDGVNTTRRLGFGSPIPERRARHRDLRLCRGTGTDTLPSRPGSLLFPLPGGR
jgi:hypothetical protein